MGPVYDQRETSCTAKTLMHLLRRLLTLLTAALPLHAQQAPVRDPSPHSDVALIADRTAVQPGDTFTAAVRLTLDPGWHTYWVNPGEAGLPIRVTWSLPAGVTVSALHFPTPHLAPQPPLMSYGYEREVLVLVDVSVAPNAVSSGPLRLSGKADWLACAEICLPASGDVALSVPMGAGGTASGSAPAIEATRAQLPRPSGDWLVRGMRTDSGFTLVALAPPAAAATLTTPYFFIDSTGIVEHAAVQRVARSGDTLVIAVATARTAGTLTTVRGVLSADVGAAAPRGFAIAATLDAALPPRLRSRATALLAGAAVQETGGVGAAPTSPSTIGLTGLATDAAPAPTSDMTLIAALAFAFIGGLLLNLMPCVFPVLSVKVLALLQHGGDDVRARSRNHGLVFGAGVLLSFWALAGILMALRAGGESLGWGFQLQSPTVVALLAMLMFALGLNLSGVFEIGLSLTRLGAAGSGGGYSDSLLTGLLAVLVAAPCTAPFMGAALGYALVQPAFVGLLVFTALGIGLALPFVLLASVPALARFLPRPGPWLETLKQAFAFPLYATVVWLLWVLGQQTGIDAIAIVLLAMILFALAAWMWARSVRAGATIIRGAAGVVMLVAVGVALTGASRMSAQPAVAASVAGWEPWSKARVTELRQAGRPVFVDFTAAWCLSCQVNERVALRTASAQRAFAAANVALLRADWTSRDSAITAELASFGRSGVPLYVMYPAGTGAASILPAVLSPGMVVDAVRAAAPAALATAGVR